MAPALVNVNLGPRSYPIHIGFDTLGRIGAVLRENGLSQKHAFILTNAVVGALYFEKVRQSLLEVGFLNVARHDIPASEEGKNWNELTQAGSALASAFPEAGIVPLVILLGGGVVGDLGGFAAGVFRRGVPFVQVPTTLLAAVDSSVGGKVGVNFGAVKNLMGIFNQPRMVLCDLGTLRSLGPREIRSGTAEIIKYGAVCSWPLFERLEQGGLASLLALEPEGLIEIVAECCRLKAAVVEQDEFDKKGIRNVLNFGHTIGHALELTAAYELTHGEAIAIGMIAVTRMAIQLGVCVPEFLPRLQHLIEQAGLPIAYPDAPGLFEKIIAAMQMDKKFKDGQNLFVLPTGTGEWREARNVDWAVVHDATRSILSPPRA